MLGIFEHKLTAASSDRTQRCFKFPGHLFADDAGEHLAFVAESQSDPSFTRGDHSHYFALAVNRELNNRHHDSNAEQRVTDHHLTYNRLIEYFDKKFKDQYEVVDVSHEDIFVDKVLQYKTTVKKLRLFRLIEL